MKTLDEIGLACETDKSSKTHNYLHIYSNYFEPLRHNSLKILEIGIQGGRSLKMWKEYFPNAHIVGLDIDDCKKFEEKRVTVVIGSQNDLKTLVSISEKYGPFDIVIDDGSHRNPDMETSFNILFPLIAEGGIYVVEDLQMCYWDATHGTGKPVFIDRIKKLVDQVNSSGKSGIADRTKDAGDAYHTRYSTKLTWWEDAIESIHLYRSIIFVRKHRAPSLHPSAKTLPSPKVRPKILTEPFLFRLKRKIRKKM